MFKFMFDEHLIFIYYVLRCSNYILCLLLISLIIYSFKYVFIFCYIQAYNARFFSPLQPSFLLFYVYTWSLEAYFNTPPVWATLKCICNEERDTHCKQSRIQYDIQTATPAWCVCVIHTEHVFEAECVKSGLKNRSKSFSKSGLHIRGMSMKGAVSNSAKCRVFCVLIVVCYICFSSSTVYQEHWKPNY